MERQRIVPKACSSENCIERLKRYADILTEENPSYVTAVRRTEDEMELSPGAGLYLYGFVPAIMEFAGWVLEEAVRSGRKRLYFLSRDGYQIYLAACRLAELGKLSVECRYLHVSRYAMRIPAYHLDMQGSLDRICAGGMEVTPERILKRGALTDAEAAEVADRIGRKDTYKDLLTRHQIAELKEILGSEPLFLNYVKAHSMEAYESTMGYLQQEGLLSDVPYAIVDSGWVGTFQQSLQTLIQSRVPDIHIEGYYFGMYETPFEANTGDYHGWYFMPGTGLRRKVYFSNSLFEAVCGADEGMTLGYFRKDGKYLPRLDKDGNPNGEKQRRNLEALRCFLEKYDLHPAGCDTHSGGNSFQTHSRDGRRLVNKLFTLFMAEPTVLETESFGDYLFSDDVLTGNCRTVADRLTGKEIRNLYILRRLCILNGLRRGRIRESAWIEGSIVRCGMYGGQKGTGDRKETRERRKTGDPESDYGRETVTGEQISLYEGTPDRHYVKRNLRHIRWYKYLVYIRKQFKAWKCDARGMCDRFSCKGI